MQSQRTSQKEIKLQYRLLRLTSRSFFIPIRMLNDPIRLDICNAYLIFRLADIIEDHTVSNKSNRSKLYQCLIDALDNPSNAVAFKAKLNNSLEGDTSQAYRELIEHTDSVARVYAKTSPYNKKILRTHLDRMIKVMLLYDRDIGRYRVSDISQLKHYAWGVAGNIGEYLHELFFAYGYQKRVSQESMNQASQIGIGLQLVNILMDTHSDKTKGYTWTPQSISDKGVAIKNSQNTSEAMKLNKLAYEASQALLIGSRYLGHINQRQFRIRFFIIFPVTVACSVLEKFGQPNQYFNKEQIKLQRKEMYIIILMAMLRSIFSFGKY